MSIEVAAGSSIDQLTQKVADAQQVIDTACRKVGVETPEAARKALSESEQAAKVIKKRNVSRKENLRDLSYDELVEKLVRLEQTVPLYLAGRAGDFAIAGDLREARREWEAAVTSQQGLSRFVGTCAAGRRSRSKLARRD